jgi:hypothetical protein
LRARVFIAPGVAARVGLGETEAADQLAGFGHLRQEASASAPPLPYFQIGYIASEPWTLAKLRSPLSPYSSSWSARP